MENTSYISRISYDIEKWIFQGISIEEIKEKINDLKDKGDFPQNLELIDAYFDKSFGSSGCAFLDTNTGETIVGFAGTNFSPGLIEGSKDVITDAAGLLISGIHKESIYMIKANKFINEIKEDGYNITQVTGHSLGGALSVYTGIYHDIPSVVTYNGAPLYVLPTAELTLNAHSIRKELEDYDGKVIRFVSSKDPLNIASDVADGFYIGEKFIINNGKPHDMKFFTNEEEQEFISKVLLNEKYGFIEDKDLSVDFDGDNIMDLSLSSKELVVSNYFNKSGASSGNGIAVEIDPSAFYYLKNNLENKMVGNDINWIRSAIRLCKSKNDSLKQNINKREDILCKSIVEGLNDASLTKVISSINDSHGELINRNNRSTLKQLSSFKTYSITRKLDIWGTSGGRTWYLNGKKFNEDEVIKNIKNLKIYAERLLYQTTATIDYPYYSSHTKTNEVYRYNAISEVGKAFVNVTNKFLNKAEQAFKGTGLRSGKNDAIVNSISEVLEVQEKNIIELEKQILSIAKAAEGLGNNFSDMDNWLSRNIMGSNTGGSYSTRNISEVYEAYLKENNIFDDVKDVIQAYDMQVESAASNLSKSVVSDFNSIIVSTCNEFQIICGLLEKFNNCIRNLQKDLDKSLTSTHYEVKYNYRYNEDEVIQKKENHGSFSQIFPSEVADAIRNARRNIIPFSNKFNNAITFIKNFKSNTYNMKAYFNNVIEKAVYDSMELDSIIKSQNLISMRINKMIKEIELIDQSIQFKYKGSALKSYQEQLKNLIRRLKVFDTMINDCFAVQKA